MKTTIDIANPLLQQAKKLAADRNTTLKAIVEEALRDALSAEQGRKPKRFVLQTRVYRGKGLQSGLSWDDWSSIRAMSYEGRGG